MCLQICSSFVAQIINEACLFQGRLGDQEGIFPISCAQFYKDEDQLKKALGYEEN